ncbi:MAG: hypothetical protein LBU14_03900 [Candidatus Peribacteria bacterium]|jgi:pyruvate kinase|nr:hypothetical protein [Candidatus Peribacteria bacterium]
MHKEIISQLMDAGTRVFRQNYSHGTHKEKYEQLQIIRQLAEEKGIANKVKVLQDLQGSKIRL